MSSHKRLFELGKLARTSSNKRSQSNDQTSVSGLTDAKSLNDGVDSDNESLSEHAVNINMSPTLNEPPAKRVKVASKEVFRDIPADEFMSKVELFQGPTVEILVGPTNKSFTLAKALLCHRSPYFDRAFNGSFKEAVDQVLSLPEISIETFQLVVQYLYTGKFVIQKDTLNTKHSVCNAYLRFFKACDHFDLHYSKEIIDSFQDKLRHHFECELWPSYANLQIAMELPSKHNARELMIGACVVPYASSMTKWLGYEPRPEPLLEFEKLMTESDDFAADLFRAYTKAAKGSLGVHLILNPITGCSYRVKVS